MITNKTSLTGNAPKLRGFVLIEIISCLLIAAVDLTWQNIVGLTALNGAVYFLFMKSLNYYVSHHRESKRIRDEFSYLLIVRLFILAIVFMSLSYLLPLKFYSLGATLLFLAIVILLAKRKYQRAAVEQKGSGAMSAILLAKRVFYTILLFFVIPILIDFHYNVLEMSEFLYKAFIFLYLLILAILMIMAFRKVQ
jgi:asparagine N-glycosylation enzyme membrane subunit Stt3